MKIAIFTDDSLPNSTLVHAKMLHELAIELKKLGHSVIIISPSHGKQNFRLNKTVYGGIELWKYRSPAMRSRGKLRRFFVESFLSLNAYLALRNERTNFHLCINYSPTIFMGPLMKWYKEKKKAFVYLVLRDMFPQWVIDQGLISKWSPLAYYFRKFEKINYESANCIGLMSKKNKNDFAKLNPQYTNIEILLNWSTINPEVSSNSIVNIRQKYNLYDKTIFFYGGNMGHAQDMPNLLRLVKNMRYEKGAHFLFVGQGDQFKLVKDYIKQESLVNATLLPSVSQETYKKILTQVDVGLFSLSEKHQAHNFPGKLLGYMLQSLPIVGSVNRGNDLVEYINVEKAGYIFVNGEHEKLKDAVKYLMYNKSARREMGSNGFNVLKKYFSVESAAMKILASYKKSTN